MLKYTDTKVTFSEIPDEITLCINISGCPNHCDGCHSSYLSEDIGLELNSSAIDSLIEGNPGITCICFMGGDQNPTLIWNFANYIQAKYLVKYKVGWYSGKDTLPDQFLRTNTEDPYIDFYHIIDGKFYDIMPFNFIKLGSYKKEFGPLNKSTTNQKLYLVVGNPAILEDITYKFWNNGDIIR